MNFKVSITIPLETIDNLMCCAFEGGSTYWATEAKVLKKAAGAEYGHETAQRGGVLRITDGEEGKTYTLNKRSIQRGLIAMSKWDEKNGAWHWGNIVSNSGNIDADTGDAFLQACIFGELIYG